MPEKLGEMLMKVGSLNAAQLERVLGAQSVYGGRLGTNLVEMGLVGEEEIARALREKSGVPCIDAGQLSDIPPKLLSAIPLALVERHRLLPIALEGGVLTVAMTDPADRVAIGELQSATGLQVVPRVCSELRLNMALEHYYGMARETRYLPADGGVWSKGNGAAGRRGEATVLAATGAGEAPGETSRGGSVTGRPDGEEPSRTMALAERLARASGEGEVVAHLLEYLGQEFGTGAVLGLKRGRAICLGAVRAGVEVEGFAGHGLALEGARLLQRPVTERRICLGELEEGGPEGWLSQALGGTRAVVLLVPVSPGREVAALICAGGVKGRLAAGAFELQRVAVMAELALKMLDLRKRIRSV